MALHVFQLQIHYAIGPQPGMNVLHFSREIPSGPGDPDNHAFNLIGGWVTNIESAWKDCLPDTVEILGYRARRVNQGGGPSVTVPANTAGTRTGTFSAGSIGPCAILSYQKAGGGWAAGRIFLPAVSEDDIDENVFDDTLLAALDDLYELLIQVDPTFIGVPDGGEYNFGVYSRENNAFSGVEAITTSGRPGTQRGRLKPSF